MTKLNPRQLEATRYIDAPCLVLAGAGSGKTRVITEKIAYLINQCEFPANRIVAVTFTNKAAREMKQRVGKMLSGKNTRGLTISTFHTLGLKIIRSEAKALNLKSGFSIFDAADSTQLIKALMLQENLTENDIADSIRNMISNWKSQFILPAEALSNAQDNDERFAAHLYQIYNRHLIAYNAVDFDDLIMLPTLLLKDNDELRQKWQNRIRYLLVDEYQDTNAAQYLMVKLLTGVRAAFTVVGDDDQSIYSWRGANPENLAQLKVDFPQLHLIKLEQNYRSTGTILKAANAVIQNNPHVFEKKLWSELGPGNPIRIIHCTNEDDEAERIATDILNHRVRHNTQFKDYAVLYRGNFQSRLIELKLQALQVPYRVSGGTSFFARGEIKDIMSYLRLVINPDDDNAFIRIVNVPRREIGPSTLEKLGTYARERQVSLFAACEEIGLEQHLPERAVTNLRRFTQWLSRVAEQTQRDSAVTAIKEMIDETGYETWLFEQLSNSKMAERKMENIWQLVESIKTMLDKAEKNDDDDAQDLKSVISKLVLLDMLEQQEQEDDSDRVQLTTLHASKGLEYPHVFLIGMEEELLPHRNSIEEGNIEEERRLFYVGITRAQRTLSLTLAAKRKQYGSLVSPEPSRFLEELPQDHLQWEGKNEKASSKEDSDALAQAHLDKLRNLLS